MKSTALLHDSLVAVALALLTSAMAFAQAESGADPVLVENATVKIRKSDFELELERLPADVRPGFVNSERRVNDLLRRMLIDRTLASQARDEGLPNFPQNARRIAAETDRMHTLLRLERIEASAAAEFDAKRGLYETRARELYTVDRAKYVTPERFSASHILFSSKSRSSEEAMKLARDTRANISATTDFNRLAQEVSEDPSAKQNSGRLGSFGASEMDPGFMAGVLGLKDTGEVSQPVQSSFGWHLIKFEGRSPQEQKSFNEVREQIVDGLRRKFVSDAREAALAKIRTDPTIKANPAAIDALVIRIDAEAVRRALQQGTPAASAPGK